MGETVDYQPKQGDFVREKPSIEIGFQLNESISAKTSWQLRIFNPVSSKQKQQTQTFPILSRPFKLLLLK